MQVRLVIGSPPGTGWLYEPDEDPKKKHHWSEPRAGFRQECGETVGKCPVWMTTPMAQLLLNTQSVPYFNRKARGPNPDRLYVVHEGVVYRAHWTRAGVSFHAFPELPSRLAHLPGAVRRQILALAESLGCKEGVLEWMTG